MKSLFTFLAAILMAVVCSCGNSGSKTEDSAGASEGASAALEGVKPVCLKLQGVYGDSSQMKLFIYPDSLVFEKDGNLYVYDIDKDKSSEEVEVQIYKWNFDVNGRDNTCPDYKKVSVTQFMTDIYGPKGKYDHDYVFIKDSKENNCTYEFQDGVEIEKEMFANHPEPKPYPELVFAELSFKPFHDTDMGQVPDLIKNAKRIEIKDYCIMVSDGKDSLDFPIQPLTDYENVYSEGYEWYFKTAALMDVPASCSSSGIIGGLKVKIYCDFDFDDQKKDPRDRGLCISFDDYGFYDVDWSGGVFKSWNNLKRKISTTYPSDEEYKARKEEGPLPDEGE